MNNRIRQVREYLGLSRSAFGKEIGVSGDTINNIERGRSEIRDPLIKLICSEFHVSEEWLRTGEGEMFQALNRHEHLASLTQKILADKPDSFRNRLITVLDSLSESEWEFLERKARELFAEQKKDPE